MWKKEKKVFSGKIFLLKERENKVLERFILDQNLLEELKKNYQIIQSFASLASTISLIILPSSSTALTGAKETINLIDSQGPQLQSWQQGLVQNMTIIQDQVLATKEKR